MTIRYRIKGQSITEFLVALLFLVPIILALPTLANMLSMQTEAYKAGRYVAWERTAYSSSNVKTDNQLSLEIENRFMVNDQQGFGDTAAIGDQARWHDFKNNLNMYDAAKGIAMQVSQSSATATQQNASAWLATNKNTPTAVQINTMQTTKVSVPLRSNISLLQGTRNVNAWLTEADPAKDPAPPLDPIRNSHNFYLASSSAIVADGWEAVNDQMFHDRVYDITSTSGNFLRFWENGIFAKTFRNVFKEIDTHLYSNTASPDDSFDMVDGSQSTNLPSNLKQYQ